jgi:uncharacterized membrane protein YesL
LPGAPYDPERPPGQFTYVRTTLRAWWDDLPLVILAGLLFAAACVPALWLFFHALFVEAILLGALLALPAWVALLAQLADVAGGVGTNIRVFFRAFPHYWLRSAGLGVLLAAPALIAFLTLPALAQPEVPLIVWLGLGADLLGAMIVGILVLYGTPLLILHDMSLANGVRNALILSSRHIWNTFGLLGMGVLCGLATIYIHSALILFWPAFWGLFIINNCRMVVAEELARDDKPARQ